MSADASSNGEAKESNSKVTMLRNKLARSVKDLDGGKISSSEFRKQWGAHFNNKEHMSVCTCDGLCPFRLAAS